MKKASLFHLLTFAMVYSFVTIGEAESAPAAENAPYVHEKDVVYGYKDGMGLIMDVFTPSSTAPNGVKLNGAGVIWVISGGMNSDPRHVRGEELPVRIRRLLDSGYVVFAVIHGSQPKYTVPEIQHDMPRAVRYIRHHADRFGIDGNRIGVMGFSSGGQLTLHLATSAPGSKTRGRDPVDRESSRVQAAVAYFPGTDMVNFGEKNKTIVEHFHSVGEGGGAPFDFKKWDDERRAFIRIEDSEERRAIFVDCSPVSYVSDDDPPTLLFHGDQDELVPIQQSQVFLERMKKAGAECKLVVADGKGHGWGKPLKNELAQLTGFFDKHLLNSPTE
ncbi:MAG: prolyl oligopeptidase family serine peptidase [Planctomycetota bacterium]